MNPLRGAVKIVNIICILCQIAKLCIDCIGRTALAVILRNKSASLERCTIESEDLASDLRREIVTLQIRRQIIQMIRIRLLGLAECTADAIRLILVDKVQFSAKCASLPRALYNALLVKGTGFFLRVKSIEHHAKKRSQCAFAPRIRLMEEVHSIRKTNGQIGEFTKIIDMTGY